MPMTVQPVDGLISRLIQQNSRAGAGGREPAQGASAPRDRVNISAQARDPAMQGAAGAPLQDGGDVQVSREGGRLLESHLLRLYREHESSGGRK